MPFVRVARVRRLLSSSVHLRAVLVRIALYHKQRLVSRNACRVPTGRDNWSAPAQSRRGPIHGITQPDCLHSRLDRAGLPAAAARYLRRGAGARLTQEELAAALGVSRQPALQALRLLKKDGFVLDAGRRGLRVAPLEAQAITQVYEVRAVLDGLATRRATLAKAQIDSLVILEGRTAAAGQRVGPMIDADRQFHHMIYAASGNPLIAETVNQHWRHIRRAMGAVLQIVGLRHAVWDEHEAILQKKKGAWR